MARAGFQHTIVAGRLTLPATVAVSFLLWLLFAVWKPVASEADAYVFRRLFAEFFSGTLLGSLPSLVAAAAVVYLLIELNNAYAVVRIRTSFQSSLYAWLLVASSFLFKPDAGCVVSLCLVLALCFLFRCYQSSHAAEWAFGCMFFLGASSLLFPAVFFLYPLFLLGMFLFRALHARSFWAGLLGWAVPYWFLWGHAFFHGQMELFYAPFRELASFAPLFSVRLPLPVLAVALWTVLLLVCGSIHYWFATYEDKIRSRAYLNFLIVLGFSLALLGILQVQHATMALQMLMPVAALLGAHLFSLLRTRFSNWLFIFFFVSVCFVALNNLWMLWFNS